MADKKISEFTDGGLVETTDEIAGVRTGDNVKVRFGDAAALNAGNNIGDLLVLEDDGAGNAALPVIDGSNLTGVSSSLVVLSDEVTDTTCFLVFAKDATGTESLHTNAALSFNASTGLLTLTDTATPLRLAYDIGNYVDFSVSSDGNTTINTSGSTLILPDTTRVSGGLESDSGASSNFRISSGSTASTNITNSPYQLLGSSAVRYRVAANGGTSSVLSANNGYATFIMAATPITEATSGTHPILAQLALRPLNVTNGTAVTTNGATLYVEGPATGTATITNNYAVWIDSGNVRIDDNLTVGGDLTVTGTINSPRDTPWVAYTPTFVGLGTPTNVSFYSRRYGSNLEILGKLTTGTPTNTEARIALGFNGTSGNVTSDNTVLSTIRYAGPGVISSNGAFFYNVLMEGNVTYLTVGYQSSTTSGITKQTGSAAFGSGVTFSFTASVPISGW